MKKKIYTLFLAAGIVIAAVLLDSCSSHEELVTSEIFSLEAFDTIMLEAVFDVELIQGDEFSIQYSGDVQAVEKIMFEVREKTLTVSNSNVALWTRPSLDPPLIKITAKSFEHVQANETCYVYSTDTLTSEKFGIVMGSKLNFANLILNCNLVYSWNASPCGGEIILSGKTKYIHLYPSNLISIDARRLPAEYAIIETSSKSDVQVHVTQQLNYSITGTGNIYVTGDPPDLVPGDITSSGRLIQ